MNEQPKYDTTNTAIAYIENGLFAKSGVENLQAQKKPILKLKVNVDGKDVEIALYFKMVYDTNTGSFTDQYKVTSTGSKMLKGDVGDPFAATSQAVESTSFLVDQGRDADELNKEEEAKFLESFDKLSKEHDLVIVSDYGHGIITPKIADYISKTDKFISLNAQVNAANIGTHSIRKYHGINCLIINATELQYEMRQRDGDLEKLALKLKNIIKAKYITVTKGKDGAFLLNDKIVSVNCPGFAVEVVDKIGSGDALLALLSVCLYSKMDEDLSLFIGSLAAAQSVETIGNSMPVNKVKLLKTISHLLK
jgi:fructose-1-phosphate kinase PfkB-like protein